MQDSPENPHRGGGGTNDGTKPKGYRKPGQGKTQTGTTESTSTEDNGN